MAADPALSALTGTLPVMMMAGVTVGVYKELFPQTTGGKKRKKKRKSKGSSIPWA